MTCEFCREAEKTIHEQRREIRELTEELARLRCELEKARGK